MDMNCNWCATMMCLSEFNTFCFHPILQLNICGSLVKTISLSYECNGYQTNGFWDLEIKVSDLSVNYWQKLGWDFLKFYFLCFICSVELDFKQQEDKLQPLMKRLCPMDSKQCPALPYSNEVFTSTPKRKSKTESKKHARWKLWFLWIKHEGIGNSHFWRCITTQIILKIVEEMCRLGRSIHSNGWGREPSWFSWHCQVSWGDIKDIKHFLIQSLLFLPHLLDRIYTFNNKVRSD